MIYQLEFLDKKGNLDFEYEIAPNLTDIFDEALLFVLRPVMAEWGEKNKGRWCQNAFRLISSWLINTPVVAPLTAEQAIRYADATVIATKLCWQCRAFPDHTIRVTTMG